ncbi:hypothetical protein FRB96_006866 [Tulasnella sp. 330]|nr:hypothetical protein FRB96_006866 [Tulasnella sp. 330]KAG8873680.1 hypothetical protein FRB97_006536 [Tulasnella sp. 331]
MSSTNVNYNNESTLNPQFPKPASQEPGYVEQATGLLSSVAATASAYLPTSVTNAVSGMTGTGTTTTSGVGGHPGEHGGVGDLGTMSTDDVARLPEERPNPDPLFNASSMGQTGSYGVGGHPGIHGGVGDLGTRSEADVAVLPDERITTGTPNTQATEDAAMLAGGLGGHDGRHHDVTKEGSTGGHSGASYDVDHGLGMPHTRSMAPKSSTNDDTDTMTPPQSTQQQDDGGVDRRQSEDVEVPSPKEAGYPTGKPNMMDKIKGTIMVAKAKAGSKDEEKIRQGTMLKETGKLVNPEEDARRAGESL